MMSRVMPRALGEAENGSRWMLVAAETGGQEAAETLRVDRTRKTLLEVTC
jgi:hypothetical protein